MPKAIEGARGAILAAARRLLESGGYDTLAMRSIAAESGMASGTIYHYFHAKDEIAWALMSEDWLEAIRLMDARIEAATLVATPAGASDSGWRADLLLDLFRILRAYTTRYAGIWRAMALLPAAERSPVVREYDRSAFMRELASRMDRAIGAAESVHAEATPAGAVGMFIARAFSLYAMDAEPDEETLRAVALRLVRCSEPGARFPQP